MKKQWYTNDKIQVLKEACPDGFHPGRLPVSAKTRKKQSQNNGMKKLTTEQLLKRNNKISATKQSRTQEQIDAETAKAKQTFLNNYGVDSPMKCQEVKDKLKQVFLDKYGVDNPAKIPSVKAKITETNLEKYGVNNVFAANEIKEKIKQTNLERYGVDNYQKTEESKEKARKHYVLHKDEILNKIAKVKLNRYNDKNYNNPEKAKQTCIERYGVDNYTKTKEYHQEARKSYAIEDIYFDSLPELAVYLYAIDHNIQIIRNPVRFEYTLNGIIHYYFPDFKYNGKLIEIKGDHFFKDNRMINPFDRSQDELFEAKHQCGLKNGVEFWQKAQYQFAIDWFEKQGYKKEDFITKNAIIDTDTLTTRYLEIVKNSSFPFYSYSDDVLKNIFISYKNNTYLPKSNYGMEIVNHFHPSIYYCNRDGFKSPIEGWQDPNIMSKVINNRLKYLNKENLTLNELRQGLTISKLAPKVSVFKPALAKYLIQKYLNNYNTIFDPCCGFSGRLLGACSLNKKYIGQDINNTTVNECNNLIKFFNLDAKCQVKDSLYDSNDYDCLFTCPPYGSLENWHQKIEEYSADDWITILLNNYNCKSYLFVVDKTEKYKKYIVEEISNKAYIGNSKEYVIYIKKPD